MIYKLFRSLKEIKQDLWDSIIDMNNITKSYQFLLSVEQAMNRENQYWYVLFWEKNELIAHACIFTHYTKLEEVTNVFLSENVISRVRSFYKKFLTLKLLGCGTPIATCSDVLTIKSNQYQYEVTKMLNQILLNLGKSQKASSIMIRDFTYKTDCKKNMFTDYDYKVVDSLPTSFVKIEWNSFDEYVEEFKSKIKVKMRRNIKRFENGNLEVKIVDNYSCYVEDMIRLYNNVYEKAENKFEKLNKEFLSSINENLNDKSKAIIVLKGDKVIGIELIVEDNDILRPLYVGIDYKYNEEYRLYFNMIYQIIKVGIERKKKYVELGQTCYYPKIKAGAFVEKMHMYIRFRSHILNKLFGNMFYKMFGDFQYDDNSLANIE